MEKNSPKTTPEEVSTHPHYYGNFVRKQFFFAAFVILAAALVDEELRNFYLFVGLFGVVGLTVLAGLTSPQKRSVMVSDVVVSAVMFLIFEYFAIDGFVQYGDLSDPVFFFRQTIAVIYLVALYYSTKTLRYYDDQTRAQ